MNDASTMVTSTLRRTGKMFPARRHTIFVTSRWIFVHWGTTKSLNKVRTALGEIAFSLSSSNSNSCFQNYMSMITLWLWRFSIVLAILAVDPNIYSFLWRDFVPTDEKCIPHQNVWNNFSWCSGKAFNTILSQYVKSIHFLTIRVIIVRKLQFRTKWICCLSTNIARKEKFSGSQFYAEANCLLLLITYFGQRTYFQKCFL